jgi:hypothetical protein
MGSGPSDSIPMADENGAMAPRWNHTSSERLTEPFGGDNFHSDGGEVTVKKGGGTECPDINDCMRSGGGTLLKPRMFTAEKMVLSRPTGPVKTAVVGF